MGVQVPPGAPIFYLRNVEISAFLFCSIIRWQKIVNKYGVLGLSSGFETLNFTVNGNDFTVSGFAGAAGSIVYSRRKN